LAFSFFLKNISYSFHPPTNAYFLSNPQDLAPPLWGLRRDFNHYGYNLQAFA
jgi:hypothetical protein